MSKRYQNNKLNKYLLLMKTTDFTDFKISLNLNIEIDNNLRRITEKIKLLSSFRSPELLNKVVEYLSAADFDLDCLIEKQCKDDEPEN